jgi:hypothetical protein
MKDELENYIIENRNSIQDSEPLEGHFERFEAKLLQNKKTKPLVSFRLFIRVAAVIVFALLVVNQVRIYFNSEKKEMPVTLATISDEYREVEFFYTSAIETGMNQWESLKHEGYVTKEEQAMMEKEQEEFDQIYLQLQKDLKANPDDERVINAMIEYYQARMNIIILIINKLNEIKQQKSESHENKV